MNSFLTCLFYGNVSWPRMLLPFAICTYSAQFLNVQHNNWIIQIKVYNVQCRSLLLFCLICFEQIFKECLLHQLWSVFTDNSLHAIMCYLLTFTFFTQCLKGVLVSLYLFSVKPEDVQLTTNVTSNKACVNDVVFFNCSAANANPPVALYQFFENDVLFGSSSSGMFSKIMMNNGNLTYKCVANNTTGATSSQNVSITVNGEANGMCSVFSPVCLFLSVPFLL